MDEEKEIDSSLKLIAKSSITIFIIILLSRVFSYLYKILIARYFGPNVYGIFSLASIIIGGFLVLSLLGLGDGILRFVPFYRGKKDNKKILQIYSFSKNIMIFSTVFFSVLLFIFSEYISINIFHEPALIPFLKYFSFLIPFLAFINVFVSFLRAFQYVGLASFLDLFFQNFLKVVLLLFFIFVGFSVNSIIFSFICATIIIFFISLLIFKIKLFALFNEKNITNSKNVARELFSYSIPLLFFGIVSIVLYWIDSLFLGFFKGSESVGIYNVAVPLAMLLGLVPDLFLQMFFPVIMKEYSKKKIESINQLSKQVAKWIFMINLPIFILFMFFPGVIINLLFRAEYLDAINAFRILCIGAFIASFISISQNILFMLGKSKTILFSMILAALMNILLNIFLIPLPTIFGIDNSLGIIGAAFATTISILFFNLLLLAEARYYSSILPFRRKMILILFISLIPLAILFFVRQRVVISPFSLFLLTGLFFLVYFLLLLFFEGFDRNDIMILKYLLGKGRGLLVRT